MNIWRGRGGGGCLRLHRDIYIGIYRGDIEV